MMKIVAIVDYIAKLTTGTTTGCANQSYYIYFYSSNIQFDHYERIFGGSTIRICQFLILVLSNEVTADVGRNELVLFDRNKHNTDYTSKKFCRETPTMAQPVQPPTCHNT